MQTKNIIIPAYFSHPIRGLKGPDATAEDMLLNNNIAILMGTMVRNACPALDLYIPAAHDEYVTEAYLRGSTLEREILEIDKIILNRRDIIIAFCYRGVISNGMKIEIASAYKNDMPIFLFSTAIEIPDLVERILNHYYETHLT